MKRQGPCRSSAYLPEMNGKEGLAEVIFDTDVIVDHLQGTRVIDAGYKGSAYSSVTRAELYSGRGADEEVIDRILGQFDEIPVDQIIAEEAGRTRRIWGLRLPDALIAATAMIAKRPLYTRNLRDFRKVKALTLYKVELS